jgi:hypothetical protein
MSHYTEIKVAFQQKHEKEVISALEEYFGKGNIEVYEEAQHMKLWDGERATGNTRWGSEIPTCHIIVRRKTQEKALGRDVAVNDLGYRRNETGGYDAYVDAAGFPVEAQQKTAQNYAVFVAENELKAKGYSVNRKYVQETGAYQVVGTTYR